MFTGGEYAIADRDGPMGRGKPFKSESGGDSVHERSPRPKVNNEHCDLER